MANSGSKSVRRKDLTGMRFGKLAVIEFSHIKPQGSYWKCQCDCGSIKCIRANSLLSETKPTQSCLSCAKMKHGAMSKGKHDSEHRSWLAMRHRCIGTSHAQHHRYGGRGIKICERWDVGENGLSGYECFLLDMGKKPSEKCSLDRINNDGNYEPDNCKWSTRKEQGRNTSTTVPVILKGEKMALVEACERLGVKYDVVRLRIYRGWTIEKALNTPVRKLAAR